MILDWLMEVLMAVLRPVVDALPTATLPDLPDVTAVAGLIESWNNFVPLRGPLLLLIAWLGALLALFALSAVLTVWRALPFT